MLHNFTFSYIKKMLTVSVMVYLLYVTKGNRTVFDKH